MKIAIDDAHLTVLVDALKCWITHYEERGFQAEHVIIAASMIMTVNKVAGAILDSAENDPEEEKDKEDETLTRGPNPDEHFVYGQKGYQKNK